MFTDLPPPPDNALPPAYAIEPGILNHAPDHHTSESSTTDLHDLGTTELYTEQDTPDLSPPDYAPTPKQPDPDPYTDLSPHDLPVIEDQRPDPVVFSTDHYLPPVPPTTRPVALRGPIDRGEVFAEEPPLSDHAGALALPEAMSVQPPEHRQPDQVVSTPPAEEHTPPEPDNQGAGDSLPPPPRDHAKERGEEEPEEPGDRSGDKTGRGEEVEPSMEIEGALSPRELQALAELSERSDAIPDLESLEAEAQADEGDSFAFGLADLGLIHEDSGMRAFALPPIEGRRLVVRFPRAEEYTGVAP